MPTNVTKNARTVTIAPEGVVDRTTLVAVLDEHYRGLAVPHTMWDLRAADVSQLSMVDFEILTKVASRLRVAQKDRRTAYVLKNEAEYARLARYLAEAPPGSLPGEHAVFRDPGPARAWLDAS